MKRSFSGNLALYVTKVKQSEHVAIKIIAFYSKECTKYTENALIMAKGLRSKRMRRNRTALRKAIIEPLTDRRLKKTTTALAEQIKHAKGSSIKALAKKLGRDGGDDEEDMDVSSEDDEEEDTDARGRSTAQRSVRSSSRGAPETSAVDDADDVTHYAPVPKRKSTFKFSHP